MSLFLPMTMALGPANQSTGDPVASRRSVYRNETQHEAEPETVGQQSKECNAG